MLSMKSNNSTGIGLSVGQWRRREVRCRETMSAENGELERTAPRDKMVIFLRENLKDCSRQRLRAFLMTLKKVANIDYKVTYKDLQGAFQEHNIKITSRVFQMMIDELGDDSGFDYNQINEILLEAQQSTGRDSVLAIEAQNDLEAKEIKRPEVTRADLIKRLENHLYQSQVYFDIEALRAAVRGKDANKSGRVTKELMFLSCEEVDLPLYGSLSKNLSKLCDENNSGYVSWPEFLSILEKAQTKAWTNHPEMELLPETIRAEKLRHMQSSENVSVVTNTANQEKTKKIMLKHLNRLNKKKPKVSVTEKKNIMEEKVEVDGQPNVSEETVTKSEVPLEIIAKGIGKFSRSQELKCEDDSADTEAVTVNGRKVRVLKTYSDDIVNGANTDLPAERLQLDWIYGYKGSDCYGNIRSLANGEIIYLVSSFAVLYSPTGHAQRHYKEHSQAISSIDVHSNGVTVATGQLEGALKSRIQAHVRVWRSDNLTTLHVINHDLFLKSISCLAFPHIKISQKQVSSKSSNEHPVQDRLAVISGSKEVTLFLYDAATANLLATIPVGSSQVFRVAFNPKYTELIVTVGREHIAWWKIYTSSLQLHAVPDFELHLRARYTYCVSHNSNGDMATGDSNGTVYIWADGHNKITNFIKHAHPNPVLDIVFRRTIILTGGKDGSIQCWKHCKFMNNLSFLMVDKSENGISALLLTKDLLILGTANNSIFTAALNPDQVLATLDGVEISEIPLTQSNRNGPCDIKVLHDPFLSSDIMTVGQDSSLIFYSTHKKLPTWRINITGFCLTACDVNYDGSLFFLGSTDGHLLILLRKDGVGFIEKFKEKVTSKPATVIRLSPDNNFVAVGCGDKSISVIAWTMGEFEEEWKLIGKFKGHTAAVTGIDWSQDKIKDSYLIRSSSLSPEQIFWDVGNFMRIEDSFLLKNVTWAMVSCCVDHSLIGTWKSIKNSAILTCVDTNSEKNLIVTGNTNGVINFFRFPSFNESFSHTYRSHLYTEKVCFTRDDRYVMSVGRLDSCLMQWRLV